MEKVSWGSGIAGLGPLDFQVSHIFIHIYTPFYLKTSRQVARRRRSTEPPGSVTLFKPGTASATSIAPKKTGAKFQPQLLLLRKKHSDQIHLINPNHKKKVPRELRSKDNYEVVLKKIGHMSNVAKQAKALECQSCCPLVVELRFHCCGSNLHQFFHIYRRI